MSSDTQGEPETPEPEQRGMLETIRNAAEAALRIAEASLELLRAELRLARRSALRIVGLGLVLIFLGVGAWLATGAAIAAGIYQLTGNAFYGIGFVALANIVGLVVALLTIKRYWKDLSLPRTRAMLSNSSREEGNLTTPQSANQEDA